jgi:hypothetical protein
MDNARRSAHACKARYPLCGNVRRWRPRRRLGRRGRPSRRWRHGGLSSAVSRSGVARGRGRGQNHRHAVGGAAVARLPRHGVDAACGGALPAVAGGHHLLRLRVCAEVPAAQRFAHRDAINAKRRERRLPAQAVRQAGGAEDAGAGRQRRDERARARLELVHKRKLSRSGGRICGSRMDVTLASARAEGQRYP